MKVTASRAREGGGEQGSSSRDLGMAVMETWRWHKLRRRWHGSGNEKNETVVMGRKGGEGGGPWWR